jgi:hypothetical protein
MFRGFRWETAPEASHCVKLEPEVELLSDLVCSALTTPVVSYFLCNHGACRGPGLSSLSQLGNPALAQCMESVSPVSS